MLEHSNGRIEDVLQSHRFRSGAGLEQRLFAQQARSPDLPFPRPHLSHGLCDSYAGRGATVQHGSANLKSGDG